MSLLHTGQCLCGGIRYEISQFEPAMAHCHCSMCRKFHGAAFASYGSVKRTNFHWTQGANLLQAYTAPNGTTRQFCQVCGSSMTFASLVSDPDEVEIALGTLDTPLTSPQPDAHIYVAYQANWHPIHDDLPQYPEGRGSASSV